MIALIIESSRGGGKQATGDGDHSYMPGLKRPGLREKTFIDDYILLSMMYIVSSGGKPFTSASQSSFGSEKKVILSIVEYCKFETYHNVVKSKGRMLVWQPELMAH